MDTLRGSKTQRGQILPLFGLLLALLLLPVAGLTVDGGVLISRHATLIGEAQAAAEAGAQAIDVTALQARGTFQLCAVPDGGATCGNGVGTVGEVISEVLAATSPNLPPMCRDDGLAALSLAPNEGAGCVFDVVSNCASVGSTGSSVGSAPDGVNVIAWQTVSLPLPVFPGWTSVRLTASATAWMEHGFAAPSSSPTVGGVAC